MASFQAMVSEETLKLLRWHAGLNGDPLDPASVSGSTAAGAPVGPAVHAFLDVLQRLNIELNGAVPSATPGDVAEESIPRSAAYAVAEVSRMLREAGRDGAARQADAAWSALLAGDIDDVPAHVALERSAILTPAYLAKRAGVRLHPRPGADLVAAADAPRFLDACEAEGVRVLGAEGFYLRGDELWVDMERIADLSSVTDPDESIREARLFVGMVSAPDLLLDFTLALPG
jgi:hypothetical protein